MGAADILAVVRAAGITLKAEGDGIRAEPRAALTDTLREGIRANREAILAALRAECQADLLALVEQVAAHYRTPPDELAEMKRIALRDPVAAWRCFLTTAKTEGIH